MVADSEIDFVVRHERFQNIEPHENGGWIIRVRDDGHVLTVYGATLDEAIKHAASALRRTGP